jgi:hypothetical protein
MWPLLQSGPTEPAASLAGAAATVLVVGAVAGFVAAVVMDLPMRRQSDGFTPAYIAASVLQRSGADAVSFPAALLVHHGAGVLAGVLWGVVALVVSVPFGVDLTASGPVLVAVPHVLGVVVTTAFIYAFFALLVLPRAGGEIYEERATAVRGQWLRSSLVFGATMLVAAPALLSLA